MKILKRLSIFMALIVVIIIANTQSSTAFYQSNMGRYANVNYQIKYFSPELRIGTDNYFEKLQMESVLNY